MPADHSFAEPNAPESYRWTIGLLLGIGVLVNYFDRVNLSVSHDALVQSFGITPAVFGQLSAAYSWTYAACQLPTGVVLDALGVRKVTLASVAIWGIASIAAAFAPGVVLFFAARLLLGIGEAPTFPANAKAVGAWFPASERSLATAIFDSAAKFANAFGVPLLGLLLLQVGWRWSFGFTAALSFGYMGLFAWLYREPNRFSMRNVVVQSVDVGDPQLVAAPPIPLARLLGNRKVLGIAIASGAYNYVFYLLLTWLPTYLAQTLHISLRDSFLFTGLPWLIAGFTDILIGGLLVDALVKRGRPGIRRVVLTAGMACGLALIGAAYAHSAATALIPIAIAIGGLSAAAPVIWSMPSLLVPNSSTGKVGGIINFSNQISAIAAPILTGYTVGATHGYTLAFAIPTVYVVIGILSCLLLVGRMEPVTVGEG